MDSLSVMLFMIIALPLSATISGAEDPLSTFCSTDARNYAANSTFESNLKQLLGSMSSDTSILGGFYNESVGNSVDTVYGQALCRWDVNSTVCRNCVSDASQEIFQSCKSMDALIWYELCQVRYSYQMFFSSQVYQENIAFIWCPDQDNQENNASNPHHFGDVLMYLMKNLSRESVFIPPDVMFATGEIKFSENETIYALEQCTRDISGDDCKNCLGSALGDLFACCSSRQGGSVVRRNCNVMFKLSQFFNDPSSSLLVY